MKSNARELGNWGEQLVAEYLIQQGCMVLEKNWRWKKAEVDLIARNKEILLFVEVKTRSTAAFFNLQEAIPAKKQLLLTEAAEAYCQQNNIVAEIRMDIAVIIGNSKQYQLNYIPAAF